MQTHTHTGGIMSINPPDTEDNNKTIRHSNTTIYLNTPAAPPIVTTIGPARGTPTLPPVQAQNHMGRRMTIVRPSDTRDTSSNPTMTPQHIIGPTKVNVRTNLHTQSHWIHNTNSITPTTVFRLLE